MTIPRHTSGGWCLPDTIDVDHLIWCIWFWEKNIFYDFGHMDGKRILDLNSSFQFKSSPTFLLSRNLYEILSLLRHHTRLTENLFLDDDWKTATMLELEKGKDRCWTSPLLVSANIFSRHTICPDFRQYLWVTFTL